MKHIPTLTLTALAAAASAQTAPAAKQELSYNRVIVSTVSGHSGAADGLAVQGQAKLGAALGGSLYVSAVVIDSENTATEATDTAAVLGFAYGLPAVAGIASDLNIELGANTLGIGIRAAVASGVEVGLAYADNETTSNDTLTVSASYSLSQFVKGLSINVSHGSDASDGAESTLIGLGYNF